ncbi:MAG TPA: pyridoxal-phosphate dependent enzyme, partial [Flexilinea sp.]|nr:pyridoxal-phosphate dependent enzyme [Flexilinea sp.]
MKIYHSVTELIGHTPLLELSRYETVHNLSATILAKIESFNPTGSVKDRPALAIINRAEADGLLKPGSV